MAAQTTLVVAIASLAGLTACTTYVDRRPQVVYTTPAPPPPAPPVYVQPATIEVVIRDERDFYEPLSPYGHWEYIGSYGRCWVPARVESNWRPYSNGHWERTDAGWYRVSDEPWGWATYHYGRWDFDPRVGWYWVPQTLWAPAWLTWHRGGGYVGWSPLPPSARIASSGVVEVNTRAIPERGYVFVEEHRFLEPVRPTTVVNNTTIINNTVNITNVKVVNNTVINEGPRTQEIEQVSGRKLRPVSARELRHKIEAPVAASHPTPENRPDAQRATPPATPVTGSTAPVPSRTDPLVERKAAERAQQEKMEAERKAQAEAERLRNAEAERKANLEAEQQRKAQAESARRKQEADVSAHEQAAREAQQKRIQVEEVRRKQELERKAQMEAEKQAREQARQSQAEAARKQQADARARDQAQRDAQQKQPQTGKARGYGEPGHKAQADAQGQPQQSQPVNARPAEDRRGGPEQKQQAEADRRGREQQKGKGQNKKAAESQPSPPATNAPAPAPQ